MMEGDIEYLQRRVNEERRQTSYGPALSADWAAVAALLEEVERLRKGNQNLRRATNRQIKAEFDARAEIERLRQCCTQRGARMQIMREWMMEIDDWRYFVIDHPEARDWFDDDGVPVEGK